MILQKEVPYVMGKMKELSETHDLVKYISDVRESGNYKVLKNRIACDLIRAAAVRPGWPCRKSVRPSLLAQ